MSSPAFRPAEEARAVPALAPAFEPLAARVRAAGLPARKHLLTIERHGATLLARLEAAGLLGHVHVDRTTPALGEDFAQVAAAGRDERETQRLLGTFYAVQLLHQNASALEQLAVDLAERSDPQGSYAAFLDRTGKEFSLLVSAYAGHVLRLALPAGTGPFVLLNVGTPSHQDDIDVAVIVPAADGRRDVDRAITRLAQQFLRYASPLDNYLAGQIGAPGFAVTPQEVRDALRSGRLDFVAVTELLRAEPVAGEEALVGRLREEATAEYEFRPYRDNARHELFLRGLLGETRSLLLRPPPPDRVCPKDDGLRLIMGLATAFKVIEGVEAAQPGDILARVVARRPELRAPFLRLDESRVFLEAFRQAAQLLIAEDEEIAVEGEAARENLGRLAAALGFRDWGPVGAVDHLLVRYHEAVEAARDAARALMQPMTRHLTQISSFSAWTRGPCPEDLASGLGEALAAATRAFRGVRFYDDLLESFSAPGGTRLRAFLLSYAALPAARRLELSRLYAEFGREAPYTLLSLLALLAGLGGLRRGVDAVDEIAGTFLEQVGSSAEAVRALSRVFRSYPRLTNRFLLALEPGRLARLEEVIGVPIGNPEVASARDAFRELVRVHRETSRYIKRVLARVTERHPATAQALSDDAQLRTLAQGRLAASERHPSPATRKGLLGDYYDIEFLRIALGTRRGAPEANTRAAFSELTTTYLARLFDVCWREVEQERERVPGERERIGIFLSGGNARGRPYDEDYDLLALLDAERPGQHALAERSVILMNAEIARRGVVVQYRLAEWFGRFVVTLDELAALLSRDIDELFVDRCQLLGSRMVIGSPRVAERLAAGVLRPEVFEHAREFAGRVAREIAERRARREALAEGTLHLKESPGGLREIDLALAVAKACAGLWEAPGDDPFRELARLDPSRAGLYRDQAALNDFLVAVRSAYRVTVAATDEVERDQLASPARILGYEDPGAAERLFEDIGRSLEESASLVDRLIAAPS